MCGELGRPAAAWTNDVVSLLMLICQEALNNKSTRHLPCLERPQGNCESIHAVAFCLCIMLIGGPILIGKSGCRPTGLRRTTTVNTTRHAARMPARWRCHASKGALQGALATSHVASLTLSL